MKFNIKDILNIKKIIKGYVLQWSVKIGLAILVSILYVSKDFFSALIRIHKDTILTKISREEFIDKMVKSWKESLETLSKEELRDIDKFCEGFIGVDKHLVTKIVSIIAKLTRETERDDEMLRKLAGYLYDATIYNFQFFLDKTLKGIIS